MEDGTLLAFGCAVTFAALGGAYVYLDAAFRRTSREDTVADPSVTHSIEPATQLDPRKHS